MPETLSKQQFFYETTRPLQVWEIAEALVATEELLKRVGPLVRELFPETSVEEVQVFLDGLRSGSFYEDFVVKLIFGNQQELDGFIERTRRKLHLDTTSDQAKWIAAAFLCLALTGGQYAVRRLGSSEAEAQIQINNSVVVLQGAQALGVGVDQFRAAIERSASDKGKLANEAIRVLRPAKGSEAGALTINGDKALTITPDTIRLIPSHVFPDRPAQYLRDFDDIEFEIRATDLDSFKRGWAAVIPTLGRKRLAMQVSPEIDPFELKPGQIRRGDVTVVFEVGDDGRHIPRRAYLSSLALPPHRDE